MWAYINYMFYYLMGYFCVFQHLVFDFCSYAVHIKKEPGATFSS